MRTTKSTITRREHDRRQRCGPGLRDVRIVRIGETDVTLQRNDVDQLGLLDRSAPPAPTERTCHRAPRAAQVAAEPAGPILFSYWRRQPHGPGSTLRKVILVDVRARPVTEGRAGPASNADWNARIAGELAAIGIEAVPNDDASGFLEDVAIAGGAIHYRRDAAPSNLLHEAGHLACIPTRFRHHAQDSLCGVIGIMGRAFERRMGERNDPDDPLIRAILQCSDPEATAWAWAFGVRCGVPPEIAILDSEYDHSGDEVRLQLSMRSYIGINGLRAGGMLHSVKAYPMLDKWIQDAA